MEALKIALIAFLVTFILSVLLADWIIHIAMTKSSCQTYGYSNFKKFINEFSKYNWQYDYFWGNSLFDHTSDSKFHANIIKFCGVGMVMKTPWEWYRVKCYVYRYIRENFKKKRIIQW